MPTDVRANRMGRGRVAILPADGDHSASLETDTMVGSILSHYSIEAELGRGGMGVVYRALDTKLDRKVAIKVLPSAALASSDDRERFYREAKSAAQLHHPNIASVFEIDEGVPSDAPHGTQPSPFIAMEFIGGGTLQDRIKAAPLKLAEAVKIAAQVAEALKAAHAKDIVHRDIKSANVMITEDGTAKVLDFGLAKTNQSTMLTRMGSTLGTVAYMSPEQARGEPVDGRTDLYSLGTMLYEMVAGRLPFAADYEQAVIYSILNEAPEPLTAVRTGVPMQLEWIVNKLLAKDAELRYQSAADLLADLKALDLSGSGMTHRSMPAVSAAGKAPAPAPPTAPTARFWPALAGGLAVVCVALLAWALWPAPAAPESPGPMRFEMQIPDLGPVANIFLSPDGRRMGVVFSRDKVLIRTLATGEDVIVDNPGTNTISFSHDGDHVILVGMGGIVRMRPDGTERTVILSSDSFLYGVYGPNDEVLYSNYSSFVVRIPKVGRMDTLRVDTPGALFPFQNTPDGRVVFVQFDGGAATNSFAWDPQDNTFERLDSPVAFITPSGHGIYVNGAGNSQVAPVDAAYRQAGEIRPISYLDRVSFAVDNRGLLIFQPNPDDDVEASLRMRGPGEADRELGRSADGRFGVSADGRRIVYKSGPDAATARMIIQDLQSGLETPIAQGRTLQMPIFHPDGSEVWGFGQAELQRTSAFRSEDPRSVLPILGSPGIMAWVPGGRSFILNKWEAGDNLQLSLVEVDTSGTTVDVLVDKGLPTGVSISPDGRFVSYFAYESNFNTTPPMTIMERSSRRTWQLPLGEQPGLARFSSDGSTIEYRQGDSLMVVPISMTDGFRTTGPPQLLARLSGLSYWVRLADGTLFWSDRPRNAVESGDKTIRLEVVVNWFDELERIAPTGRR